MNSHKETRVVPYSCEQMFDLVAGVDEYKNFLPWCMESRVTKREGDVFYADLVVGHKMIRERFSSKVTTTPFKSIHVEYIKGPMRYLSNNWKFTDNKNGSCTIDFYLEFEFKNLLMRRLMEVFFNEIVRRMVGAFEARAKEKYSQSNTH